MSIWALSLTHSLTRGPQLLVDDDVMQRLKITDEGRNKPDPVFDPALTIPVCN